MKEVVEMLFCRGLIKVLLSAETGDGSQFCAVQSTRDTVLTQPCRFMYSQSSRLIRI